LPHFDADIEKQQRKGNRLFRQTDLTQRASEAEAMQ
jgi:hypothetical protein